MKSATRKLADRVIAITTLFCMTTQGALGAYLDLADQPLFIGANVPPQVMLTISKEQQLYRKAYNDYSDLDPEDGLGELEKTYKHAIDYYGYFDSYKCYSYDTASLLFVPVAPRPDQVRNTETDDQGKPTPAAIEANKAKKYCVSGSGQWSGNFLNWISMSRMDTVRKLLYGGLRSTDTAAGTVLERAHFPADAHAWAKYYSGRVTDKNAVTGVETVIEDIHLLTPFTTVPLTATPGPARRVSATVDYCTFLNHQLNVALPAPVPLLDESPCGSPVPAGYVAGGFTVDYKEFEVLPPPSSTFSTPPAVDYRDYDIGFTENIKSDPSNPVSEGDQVLFEDAANPGRVLFQGVVRAFPTPSEQVLRVRVQNDAVKVPLGTKVTGMTITNLSRTGISFCNVTIASANYFSQINRDPPLIRVAQGNFQLWSANEKYQCYWRSEPSLGGAKFNQGITEFSPGGLGSNGNQAVFSDINASAENPSRTDHALNVPGVTTGDYVARVAACVPGFFGTERCKQYPDGNYKPIGLLQEYGEGDTPLIQFGLMTGSYRRNISGGVLRKNISGNLKDEINYLTNGTFTTPAVPPDSPRDIATATPTPAGIVNTLNYIRIWGYKYEQGSYTGTAGDGCAFQLTQITEDSCTSWGNPMSEIYFESLRYFAGGPLPDASVPKPTPAFTYDNAGSKDNQLGLPLPDWNDPLSNKNYCAPLNVLVFNASVSTTDDDLRDTVASSINSSQTAAQLTDGVGAAEGINGFPHFAGKLVGPSATASTDVDFELCTPKNIPGLGDVSGICPEGPTLGGSFLIAGLAHHARTNRIRTTISVPPNDNRSLKVTTYGIQLATNVPTLNIPVPGTGCPNPTTCKTVIIQPIYRLTKDTGTLGGGALVDLKIIKQNVVGNVASGKIYINWEDSEQGGDFDQDMWGTLDYELDATAGTIKITTNAISESTSQRQGFGYTISGTTQDGPHFHSGIGDTPTTGFSFVDPTGALACTNCQVLGVTGPGIQSGPTSHTYTLGSSTGKTLQDPLWYAAKYGGFTDSNGNNLPNNQIGSTPSEWDSKRTNGQQGSDGIPDTYFLVTNPLGLVAALDRAFVAILSNASASSVATNSTSLQTGTTIYQARFNANDWSGQVLALGVDDQGRIATNENADWDAGKIVNAQSPLLEGDAYAPAKAAISTDVDIIKASGRTIITWNNTHRKGVPFRWPGDTTALKDTDIPQALVDNLNLSTPTPAPAFPAVPPSDGRGRERLEWTRGSTQNAGAATTSFRVRPISVLGDIVNSNPNFVAQPSAGFGDQSYLDFRKNNLTRKPMVYVGGNDGMLHAFRAGDGLGNPGDGREVLAYIPSMVHNKLNKLTDQKYAGNEHRYYVDGSPEIGDAFFKVGTEIAESWRTVLVGALGGGGQGVFALDITKPDEFAEGNAAKIALWEFSDKDDPDLGYIYAQPTIRRMANGKFAAIVPGGYNASKAEPGETPCTDSTKPASDPARGPAGCSTNTTGSAYLFILFLDGPGTDGVWNEGTDYIKIRAAFGDDTAGTPNGLTQPLAADIDADGFVDFIYAGDLRGNLWKFDVRLPPRVSPPPPAAQLPAVPNPTGPISDWTLGDNRVILFVARDPNNNTRQPITGKPEATLHPTTGFIITFGTGKYLERNDPYPEGGPPPAPPSSYQTQSFYGIWDKDDARPIAKASADENLAPSPLQTVVTSRDQLLPHRIQTADGNDAIRVVVPIVPNPVAVTDPTASPFLDTPVWSGTLKSDPPEGPPDADDSPTDDPLSKGKHMGWRLDFPNATPTEGERSVFRPILTAGRLIFSTLIPSTETCLFGGTSFTMVIDPVTGGGIKAPVLDTDPNGLLNDKDVVTSGDFKDIYASGLQSGIGITPTPTIIRAGSLPPDTSGAGSKILGTSGPLVAAQGILLAYALSAGSSGGNASTMIGLTAAGGRVSWRELLAE